MRVTNLAFIFLVLVSCGKQADQPGQDPGDVVKGFIEDLGRKNYKAAFEKTDETSLGRLDIFKSDKSFGRISSTEIHSVSPRPDEKDTAVVLADASFTSAKGTERLLQLFYLLKFGGNWKIIGIKVTKDSVTTGTGLPEVSAIQTGQMTDSDGNVYKTVVIGGQEWMAENLRTTNFNDGTPLMSIEDEETWITTYSGAFCAYDNDQSNVLKNGYLYNGFAVNSGQLAPAGWRVPTDSDWTQLSTFLGGDETAGAKLKSASCCASEGNGTDDFGFGAVMSGYRSYGGGTFGGMGTDGGWWSSSENDSNNNWSRFLSCSDGSIYRDTNSLRNGFSVRLIREK
ncbi:MAG: fibrobacter succinogenes major paralogous domain-containing protein [Bacteroidetes bacterium]|nr:fibrobacter succinogenes major paralogous domain-containing protein [Bacteroidota bacterium]